MIVLFNVKITDIRMGYPYTRGPWMPNPERFDVFKYCLASTRALDPVVTKYAFYITLAPELAHRQAELDQYIHELFPEEKLQLKWKRNDFGRDWRQNMDELLTDPNELVWLAANDDHIFLDSDLNIIHSAIQTLNNDPDPNALVYYSHWPEQMRMAHHHGATLTKDGNFVKFDWETFDGIMILKAGRLKKYWERDYGDALMFKPDYLGGHHGYQCPGPVYAPTKEIVRHYEGYSHVGTGCDNVMPPLYVPHGFFNKKMKIRIGYPDRIDGWINLYSAAEWLYNTNPAGADFRWCVEDLPLFWQEHIDELDVNLDQDINMLHQARNAALVAGSKVPMTCFGITFEQTNTPPSEWFNNHLL